MFKYLKTTLLLLLPFVGFSQKHWIELQQIPASRNEANVVYMPTSYKAFELRFDALKEDLIKSPDERSTVNTKTIIQFPNPSGKLIDFNVKYSPVMENQLAEKFPTIKTYKIISLDRRSIGRIDITPLGFHAVISSEEGEYYIDPIFLNDNFNYITYFTRDNTEPKDWFQCGVDHTHDIEHQGVSNIANLRTDIVNFHTYKLALACTGEWGAKWGTVEATLANMVTGINRVNLIYESEFASRVVLINDNDKLIHLNGATDPYNNPTEGRLLLGENTAVVNQLLGNNTSYDIGHVVTANCSDVGGIASLGSACRSGDKANGVTCSGGSLINAATRVLAHEMGHQFSAQHTFNVCDINSDQNAGLNGFEPGSGTTIMSYAGACGSNNVQNSEDAYYHQGSLDQIYEHTRINNLDCPDITTTTNHFPTVNILTPANTLIPKETPFVLDGEGFDEDGDILTFNFEEKDASTVLCALGNPEGTCPQFRSVVPDTFPYRIFPRPNDLLSGSGTKGEVLPKYSRDLKFVFTARDNNAQGGVASWKEFNIKADANAGPFRLISPNLGENYSQGEIIDVTWEVANTDKAPFNTEFVDIYLSTKRALHTTNPNLLLLSSRIPNTGQAKIQLPSYIGNDARVIVRGHGKIFFDISNFSFILKEGTIPTAYVQANKYYEKLCLPASTAVNFTTVSIAGYNGNIKYVIDEITNPKIQASFENETTVAGVGNKLNINVPNSLTTGYYSVYYSVILDNNDTLQKRIDFDVISTDFSSVATLLPANGEKDAELPTFRWNGSPNATSYTIEVSKSPLFINVESGGTVTDTFFKPSKTFDKKSLYFWRMKATNACGDSEWSDTKSFGTLSQDCKNYAATGLPINISQSGTPLISSKINIPAGTNISDVNVTKLKINHNNFADLTGTLISHTGTKVILWDKICPKSLNIEVLIDDQAPNPFSCSNTAAGQYTPKEKLEKFNGENATGTWQLDIKDNTSGNGGRLDIFELEICASVEVQNPFQVNNNLLTILPSEIGQISSEFLKTDDNNNSATDLIYTIIKSTRTGNLLKNGIKLNVGDTFTQADINNGAITYAYTGDQNQSADDGFNFVVQDNEGGWIGVNRFNIRVNSPNAVDDNNYNYKVSVYPNPANDFINIKIEDSPVVFNKMTICNSMGQQVKTQSITNNEFGVDISNLQNGLFFIELSNGIQSTTLRFTTAR